MAGGASREARLIRWSRSGIAAATERSSVWAAVAGRRPHHIAMAALARGVGGGGAASAPHRDGGARGWDRGWSGAALGGGERRGRRGGNRVRGGSFDRRTAVP